MRYEINVNSLQSALQASNQTFYNEVLNLLQTKPIHIYYVRTLIGIRNNI